MAIMVGAETRAVRFAEIPYFIHRQCPWHLIETNWIVSSQGNRPQDAHVIEPSTILIISRHGHGSVDFRQAMLGLEWTGCYTP